MFQNIRIPLSLACGAASNAQPIGDGVCFVDPCSTTHNILFESRRSPTPPLTPHAPLSPSTSSFSYTLLVIISFPLCFHPLTTLETCNRAGSQGGGAGDDPHVLSARSSRTRIALYHRDIRALSAFCTPHLPHASRTLGVASVLGHLRAYRHTSQLLPVLETPLPASLWRQQRTLYQAPLRQTA
jgi:hypothetical protein